MKLRRLHVAAAVIVALGLSVAAAEPPPPQVALPLMKTTPTIDGVIHPDEWAGATKVLGFVSQHDGKLTARDGEFRVGCDGKQLYIAIQTAAPPSGTLLNRAVPDGERDIMAALRDDSIELWIDPHRGNTSGDRRLFQIITNGRGAIYDRSYDLANPQNPVNNTWRVQWTYANKVSDGWWQVEIAIPLSVLGAEHDLDHPWGIRVVRDWLRPWDQSRWASTRTAFDDVESMPVVTWDEAAPVTQMVSLHQDHKEPRIGISLFNSGTQPLKTQVFLSDTWSMNPPDELRQTVTIAPGKTEVVSLKARDQGPEGDHHTIIKVTAADGGRVYFLRDFRWNMHPPATLWTIEAEQQQAVDLQFKYYPYYNKVKVKVDVSALSARDRVTGVQVVVRPAGKTNVLRTYRSEAKTDLSFKHDVAEGIFAVPDLPDGEYEVAAFLHGGAGVPQAAVVKTFERRHFPWEHNKLGLSDAVIPPFTPFRVTGNTVSCVLRDHTVDGDGVWNQVRSDGRDLLAAPMHWEVTSAGKPLPVSAGQLRCVTKAPNQVVTDGGWKAGSLAATVHSDYDYDGMMKVTLSLAPSNQPVDGVSLVIPLRGNFATYLHTCGDGLRDNYAGKTPPGEGVIWDSSKGNKLNIVGTFYPYVYLGGPERGIAWFADTDRDWVLDDKTPTIQIVRHGGVTELRVHFITRPTTLTRQHDIVFGLQATPVKPMPQTPVNWRRWRCNKVLPECFAFTTLGSTFYWGGVSYDLYPRHGDFSIYDWIRDARANGKADLDFVKPWLAGYSPDVKPGTDLWKKYEAHIMYTAHTVPAYPRSAGAAVIPYTNPRGAGFQSAEWPTFQDEWINFEYYNRARQGEVGYDITPTESFRDCALYYYRKAMTCFDGVYWDNIYMSADRDTVAGGAWVDEQGRVHPSMGLWAMRELIRRTAVMYHELGKQGVFICHMTNTDIVPILAFANVNLDWEWQYGDRDFPDRFTPDLTVAETIGRKTGNVPLILSGGFYDRNAPRFDWVMRTRLGVALVHELRVWDYGPKETVDFLRKLNDFGYGEPDCRVFNYWNDDNPVRVTGIDARTIAMARDGKALVIVTDYGGGGDATVALDTKALGISGSATATDFETGAPVAGSAAAGFKFELKKHDFKALLIG